MSVPEPVLQAIRAAGYEITEVEQSPESAWLWTVELGRGKNPKVLVLCQPTALIRAWRLVSFSSNMGRDAATGLARDIADAWEYHDKEETA